MPKTPRCGVTSGSIFPPMGFGYDGTPRHWENPPIKRTFGLLLLVLALAVSAACSRGPDPTPSPYTGYLTEGIPPCTPVEGISVDPCESDAPTYQMGVYEGFEPLGDEPSTLRFIYEDDQQPDWVTHLALRGTYFPGTVRCTTGDVFRPPPYLEDELVILADSRSIKCYIDVRANAYLVGSGPPTLTVLVFRYVYTDDSFTPYLEEGQT